MLNTQKDTFFCNFEFRTIKPFEADQTVIIEQTCFPPNEACSPKSMVDRALNVSELFFVAIDKNSNKIAGFINGIATDEEAFRDEFFNDYTLHNISGKNIMILGLDVLPQHQNKGLGREIVRQYILLTKSQGRKKLVLTCLDKLVKYYEKLGFTDKGMSQSTWGGESWHEMELVV